MKSMVLSGIIAIWISMLLPHCISAEVVASANWGYQHTIGKTQFGTGRNVFDIDVGIVGQTGRDLKAGIFCAYIRQISVKGDSYDDVGDRVKNGFQLTRTSLALLPRISIDYSHIAGLVIEGGPALHFLQEQVTVDFTSTQRHTRIGAITGLGIFMPKALWRYAILVKARYTYAGSILASRPRISMPESENPLRRRAIVSMENEAFSGISLTVGISLER